MSSNKNRELVFSFSIFEGEPYQHHFNEKSNGEVVETAKTLDSVSQNALQLHVRAETRLGQFANPQMALIVVLGRFDEDVRQPD